MASAACFVGDVDLGRRFLYGPRFFLLLVAPPSFPPAELLVTCLSSFFFVPAAAFAPSLPLARPLARDADRPVFATAAAALLVLVGLPSAPLLLPDVVVLVALVAAAAVLVRVLLTFECDLAGVATNRSGCFLSRFLPRVLGAMVDG